MPRTSALELGLRPLELLRRWSGPAGPRFPPTFLVGAPRTGTTVMALHVLNALELAYIPNASRRFHRTALVRCARARRQGSWDASYENCFGHAEGELAPSDGWELFNRALGSYRHATAADAAQASGLRGLVAGFERCFEAPFFVKNTANSTRVEALAELFPGALFVHVTRAYPDAARSLLEARRKFGIALGAWWGAAPSQFLERKFENEVEQVALTLGGIDAYLREQLPRVASGRFLEVRYESFCERPGLLLEWIEGQYTRLNVPLRHRDGAGLQQSFQTRRAPEPERTELAVAIERVLAREAPALRGSTSRPR